MKIAPSCNRQNTKCMVGLRSKLGINHLGIVELKADIGVKVRYTKNVTLTIASLSCCIVGFDFSTKLNFPFLR